MTARELFYASAGTPAAAAPAKPAASRPAPRANRPASPAPSRERPTVARDQTPAPQSPRREEAAQAPPVSGAGAYTPAAYRQEEARNPLGLRYTILKLVDGRMREVAPDSVFHAGDRIQVSLEANDTGYLYIVHQGTSGTWKPLFPSPEVEEGDNRVEKGRAYVMPPKSRFYFDGQAGEEKLFIVLSRRPEPDLENLIYNLKDGGRPAPAEPVSEPAPRRETPVMLASNIQIGDGVVGRLRNVYARDLVVEKVDDEAEAAPAAGGRKEKAVYVVNVTGSPDSRVVADVRLTHK